MRRALGCKGTPCFPVLHDCGRISAQPDCASSPAVGHHLSGMAAITANEFQVFALCWLRGGGCPAPSCSKHWAGTKPLLAWSWELLARLREGKGAGVAAAGLKPLQFLACKLEGKQHMPPERILRDMHG